VAEVVNGVELLNSPDCPATAGDLRLALDAMAKDRFVEPEDLWDLAAEQAYAVNVSWARGNTDGSFDAVFYKRELHAPYIGDDCEEAERRSLREYANDPLREMAARSLAPELRLFLESRLPAYMVPSTFVTLPALPLTRSGKVDRGALPAADSQRPELEAAYVAPRDPIELRLVRLWEEMIEKRPIGVKDSFFDLGGHSLLAVRLIAQIEKTFDKKIPLSGLFSQPTIEQLARYCESSPRLKRGRRSCPFSLLGQSCRCTAFIRPVERCSATPRWPGGSVRSIRFSVCRARGIDGLQPPDTNMRTMAADYVNAIRTHQPEGPYRLAGWSFGGAVAYEMASQLIDDGQTVQALALIDAVPGFMRDAVEPQSLSTDVT
jgi:acyl carrier protein